MKKEKLIIEQNTHLIKLTQAEAEATVKQLNNALNTVKTITESNIKTLDIDALNSYLNACTGFKNAYLSSQALGIEDEYNQIIEASKIKDKTFIFFDNSKELFAVDANKIKEAFTSYLTENATEIYDTLLTVCKALNEIPNYYHDCFKTENGKLLPNTRLLNTKYQMNKV